MNDPYINIVTNNPPNQTLKIDIEMRLCEHPDVLSFKNEKLFGLNVIIKEPSRQKRKRFFFICDISNSMKVRAVNYGECNKRGFYYSQRKKISAMKKGVSVLVDDIVGIHDTVTLVEFDHEARIVYDNLEKGSHLQKIKDGIQAMKVGGGTRIDIALLATMQSSAYQEEDDLSNMVFILCTDGRNDDIARKDDDTKKLILSSSEVFKILQGNKLGNFRFYCMGIGIGYDGKYLSEFVRKTHTPITHVIHQDDFMMIVRRGVFESMLISTTIELIDQKQRHSLLADYLGTQLENNVVLYDLPSDCLARLMNLDTIKVVFNYVQTTFIQIQKSVFDQRLILSNMRGKKTKILLNDTLTDIEKIIKLRTLFLDLPYTTITETDHLGRENCCNKDEIYNKERLELLQDIYALSRKIPGAQLKITSGSTFRSLGVFLKSCNLNVEHTEPVVLSENSFDKLLSCNEKNGNVIVRTLNEEAMIKYQKEIKSVEFRFIPDPSSENDSGYLIVQAISSCIKVELQACSVQVPENKNLAASFFNEEVKTEQLQTSLNYIV